jgi:acyl-CoA synthetase (NDP forming)
MAKRKFLSEPDAKELIAIYGIPVPEGCAVSGGEINELSGIDGLCPPFAVKIISPSILHKSESGGVALELHDAASVAAAITDMQTRHSGMEVSGYLVEEMADPGLEMVIGARVDPVFGPMLLVGLGGIFVEALDDISLRLCPVSRTEAQEMLDALRGARLLKGYRGKPAVDVEAVVDAMIAIGGEQGLIMHHQGVIASLDINPLIVTPEGCRAVDARVVLQSSPANDLSGGMASTAAKPDLTRLFYPRSIAVVGVASDGSGPGNAFIRNLRSFGFAGSLSIVHPAASEIAGIPCFPTLGSIPHPVDYCYVAIPAARVPEVLEQANGQVAFAQVMSSGFAETPDGARLQDELVHSARVGGVRIIGPNCLGLHAAQSRVTFIDKMSGEAGNFGVISQSGGIGVDILRHGQASGLRFSHLLTIGNAADVSAVELLEHMLEDRQVKAVGMYLESVPDGRALLAVLRARLTEGKSPKPVLLLRGGRSAQGRRAALSHTGALASEERVWAALAAQAGVVQVDTLEDFIDCAVMFQQVEPDFVHPTTDVCLFGNGGGASVLACDSFDREGLIIKPFSAALVERIGALGLPPGASVLNPIDTPAGVLSKDDGAIAARILDLVYDSGEVNAIVLHLNMPVILGYYGEDLFHRLVESAMEIRGKHAGKGHFVLVLRSDGSEEVDRRRHAYRKMAMTLGVAVFDSLPQAARALAALEQLERYGQTPRRRI